MAASPFPSLASAVRAVRDGVIFLVCGALVCVAIQRCLPFPQPAGIYQKYEFFAQHRDEYDALFLGSSRFYHHIIPRQFDAAVAGATGREVRSFNFGYDAMWPPESYYMVRQLLALRPARLRWVIIDMMDINPRLDERNTTTLRHAYWHDWRHTRMAMEEIVRTVRKPDERWRLLSQHAEHLGKQWLNLGRGADLLGERLLAKTKKWSPPKDWIDAEGFNPGPALGLTGKVRADFERTAERLRGGLRPSPLSPVLHAAMSELIGEIHAAGAQPVFVLSPTLSTRENFTGLPEGAPLLAFNDPQVYPQLFDPDLRYDAWHLNERGAVLFTDALARRFAEWLGSGL